MTAHARAYRFGKDSDQEEVKRRLRAANPSALVQVTRAGSLNNELVAEMMAAQTFRAEASRSLLAKKPEIDLLLRLAGTTQISKAIRSQGAVTKRGFLAIAAGRSAIAVPPEFRSAELPRRRLSEAELARIERAALLDAQRG